MKLQHLKPRKLTKRQRKAQAEPNAMVKHSLKHGDRVDVHDATYAGRNPQYRAQQLPGMPVQWLKVAKGIPFVRVA